MRRTQREEKEDEICPESIECIVCRGSCAGNGRRACRRTGNREETQHPFHHGRRHRLDAAEHLPSRTDGRRDTQHRPYRARGCEVHDLLRRAKLHGRAHGLLHRHDAAARRHDPAAIARQPVLPAARHAIAGPVPARPRLHHRRVRQEPSGRPLGCAADGARLPGVLGLPVPPGRDAGRELPRHQQDPDRAGHRAAVQEHAGARPQRPSRARWMRRPRCA